MHHLSVELDSEDVAGVTVVAYFCALLEVVNAHTLWCSGAHHNNQTACEQTLYDVHIRIVCWERINYV